MNISKLLVRRSKVRHVFTWPKFRRCLTDCLKKCKINLQAKMCWNLSLFFNLNWQWVPFWHETSQRRPVSILIWPGLNPAPDWILEDFLFEIIVCIFPWQCFKWHHFIIFLSTGCQSSCLQTSSKTDMEQPGPAWLAFWLQKCGHFSVRFSAQRPQWNAEKCF